MNFSIILTTHSVIVEHKYHDSTFQSGVEQSINNFSILQIELLKWSIDMWAWKKPDFEIEYSCIQMKERVKNNPDLHLVGIQVAEYISEECTKFAVIEVEKYIGQMKSKNYDLYTVYGEGCIKVFADPR